MSRYEGATAIYENTKARDATVKREDAKKGSAKNSVRSFCRSLLRGKPGSFGKSLGEPARIAAFCFLVTQIDTQALLQGALTDQKQAQTLIGLVAEEGLEPPTRGL